MTGGPVSYDHTQRAPLCLLLYAMAALFMVLSWVLRDIPIVAYILPAGGALILVLAASFHHLSVVDEVDHLAIRFGPLPLFRRRVRYEDITSVEVDRTTILDGWGIHISPRGGWVWNLWGRDCVKLRLRNSQLRIGTDDAANLAQWITGRISSGESQDSR